MKNRSGLLRLLLFSITLSSFIGCDSQNAKNPSYETLVFNVDETKLEPVVTDTVLKIKMAPPRNWKQINESTLAEVISKAGTPATEGLQVTPRWIFLHEGSQAVCVVSALSGMDLGPNETLLETLATAYRNEFPHATVQQAIFMKGAFRVHQIMVIAADSVLIKLICDAPETLVFEVDYRVPKNVYQTELRAIESSIGSINLIHKQR